MKKKLLFSIVTFIAVLFIHMAWLIREGIQLSNKWVQIEELTPLDLYFERQDYYLGIAYALAGAFTIYALLKFLDGLKSSAVGVVGGVTLTGLLYFAGCFLIGCCGSPMLVIYISLFGSSFLEFAKPLTMIITMVSVLIGFIWLEKKTKTSVSCCTEAKLQKDNCDAEQRSD